jgi:uncharacterized protein YcbK (DUF882 family)
MAAVVGLVLGWDLASAPTTAGETGAAPPPPSRFFLSGDGEIAIESAHTGERVRVRYRRADGTYDRQALDAIDALFRSRGDDERTRVSLRLIEAIDYLQDRERPRAILLVSGYRSGEYNAAIIARGGKAARTSMHGEGLAADLRFVGLDHRALWNEVRALECCGAGYYATNGFLHLDVGRPRFWEEGTSRVSENLSRGNARVIARTEFDRYATLDGGRLKLHAVTLRPLRIARTARFRPDGGDPAGDAAPSGFALRLSSDVASGGDGECMEFAAGEHAPPIALELAEDFRPSDPQPAETPPADAAAGGARTQQRQPSRGRIVVHTCEPRLEATPETIESNPVEIGAAAATAAPGRSAGG